MAANTLEAWQDVTLQVEDLSPRAVASAEAVRLSGVCTMAAYAGSIPRRLGGDATPQELAADKKLCRQVGHKTAQLLGDWMMMCRPEPVLLDDDDRPKAAQVVWSEWWEDHQSALHRAKVWIATWGLKYDHIQEANKFLNLIHSEEAQLKRLFEA